MCLKWRTTAWCSSRGKPAGSHDPVPHGAGRRNTRGRIGARCEKFGGGGHEQCGRLFVRDTQPHNQLRWSLPQDATSSSSEPRPVGDSGAILTPTERTTNTRPTSQRLSCCALTSNFYRSHGRCGLWHRALSSRSGTPPVQKRCTSQVFPLRGPPTTSSPACQSCAPVSVSGSPQL